MNHCISNPRPAFEAAYNASRRHLLAVCGPSAPFELDDDVQQGLAERVADGESPGEVLADLRRRHDWCNTLSDASYSGPLAWLVLHPYVFHPGQTVAETIAKAVSLRQERFADPVPEHHLRVFKESVRNAIKRLVKRGVLVECGGVLTYSYGITS